VPSKATSRAALDIETHLLPVEQQIWKHDVETLGRMLTSNDLSEISDVAERPSRKGQQRRRTHVSPLRSIIAQAKAEDILKLSGREKVPPFVAPPWWQSADIHIASRGDEAHSQHDIVVANEDNACIYTNGSCIQGHTGAVAV
jgi:hypothetical protein